MWSKGAPYAAWVTNDYLCEGNRRAGAGTERGMMEHSHELTAFVLLFSTRGEDYLACLEQLAELMIAVAREAEGASPLLCNNRPSLPRLWSQTHG